MNVVFRAAVTVAVGLHLAGPSVAAAQREPHTALKKHGGLTDADLRDVDEGKVVVRVMDTPVNNEVAMFGVVWINASPEDFVAKHRDIETFESGDAVQGIQKISQPPVVEDFETLTFPSEDLDDLSRCKLGDCPVKIDEESLVRIQREVDWSSPNAHDQANRFIRHRMVEGLTAYVEGGNDRFAAYRDKKRPTYLVKEFEELLANSPYILEYDPELHGYLEAFPDAELPEGAEEFLYWSKVQFGLKPTVRVSHVVILPIGDDRATQFVIGSKMLYASHYFHTGLELKYLSRDTARPDADGFYLISVNRSRSDGLTGLFGGIVRRGAVSEARKGLASALETAKRQFESRASAAGAID